MGKLTKSQQRRLGVAGKALNLTLDGEKLPEKVRSLFPEGPFEEIITLSMMIKGDNKPDYVAPRQLGVKTDFLINCAVAMIPGFTEDYFRRLACVATELFRAEAQGREIRTAKWTDSEGVEHKVDSEELRKIRMQVDKRKKQLEEVAKPLSKILKMPTNCNGRFEVDVLAVKVREGDWIETGDYEVLKEKKKSQTKKSK